MAGLLGYALAGGLAGYGNSLVEEAKAKREAAMEELRNSRLMEREDRDRSFRTSEREASQGFSARENAANRQFQSESRGDLVTLDDGSTGVRVGSTVKPLTDAEGNQRRVVSRDGTNTPAEVRTAEWLIQNGVAENPEDAWRQVRTARDNPNSRARLVSDIYKSMTGNMMDRRSDAEKQQAAREFVEGLLQEEEGPPPAAAQPTQGGAQQGLPAGTSPEQAIEQAKAAIERGADKAQVRSRLRQMGIDPSEAGL
jgi:hypothetical protein